MHIINDILHCVLCLCFAAGLWDPTDWTHSHPLTHTLGLKHTPHTERLLNIRHQLYHKVPAYIRCVNPSFTYCTHTCIERETQFHICAYICMHMCVASLFYFYSKWRLLSVSHSRGLFNKKHRRQSERSAFKTCSLAVRPHKRSQLVGRSVDAGQPDGLWMHLWSQGCCWVKQFRSVIRGCVKHHDWLLWCTG